MQGNGGAYAVKRRKKPVQKITKPPPAKTNPSKRHRDRLNTELDRLTGLLPFSEEVRGRLDKLSVLRLSVGYLKVQSHFRATLQANGRSAPPVPANGTNGQAVYADGVSEGELLLQALNGFVLVVTTDGTVFYASPTIRDFLGFHQSDVVHQSVYDLVHVEDRDVFKCHLHFALNPDQAETAPGAGGGKSSFKMSRSSSSQYLPPENSSFLERSFCCRFRRLMDNASGFMALNFNGRLKYLHLRGNAGADGTAAQLALFAIATPVRPPSVMEIRAKILIFQTKHSMDFAPMGIDTRGKLVLGYSEVELVTTGSGYQFVHAADMMYCADNHFKMMKTGDTGFTFFRLLTKTGQWQWVQASARVVFKGGRPDFIIARQKALTNEEGEEHMSRRRQQLPFDVAKGEGVLYEATLDVFSGPGSRSPSEPTTEERPLDPASLLGSLRRQDHSVYAQPQTPGPLRQDFAQTADAGGEQSPASMEQAFLDSHALFSVFGETQTLTRVPSAADLAADAVVESLEHILADIGDGGIEGLALDRSELRDWENTIVRMNNEREEAAQDSNRAMANDVFSYVEEALRRELVGVVVQGSVERPSFVNNQPQWRPVIGMESEHGGFGEVGNILSKAGHSTGPRGKPQIVSPRTMSAFIPARCETPQQGHASSLWPPGSGSRQPGNEGSPAQLSLSRPAWLLSPPTANDIHGSPQLRPQPPGPASWQEQQQRRQQQLSQSCHYDTLSHSSHTAGSVNSRAPPQARRPSGSCMYGEREGHVSSAVTVPNGYNGHVLGPAATGAATHTLGIAADAPPFTVSCPGVANSAVSPGWLSGPSSRGAACADAGNGSFGHLGSGEVTAATHPQDYPAGNGALPPPPFCFWNGDTQIPKVPLTGVVEPHSFSALPAGSLNFSNDSRP